jgi:hypothetical protein
MHYFNFILITWGRTHTGVFLDVGLPSLLSDCNLPNLRNLAKSRFQVFTTVDDLELMEAAPSFRLLRELINVETQLIDDWFSDDRPAPHAIMSRAHRIGLESSYKLGQYSVFVPPDCVWANGSFTALEQIARRGVRIVHISGLRLTLEDIAPALEAWRSQDATRLSISPRELVRLGMAHIHDISKNSFFREQGSHLMPANLLWTVADQGILARCFHLHPLLVEPDAQNANFRATIDDDLCLTSGNAYERDYVVSDSDEILVFELSSKRHQVVASFKKGCAAEIAAWAQIQMNAFHRRLVETPIRLHAVEIDPVLWQPVEIEAESTVQKALDIADKPSNELASRFDRVLEHRMLAVAYRGQKMSDWLDAEGLALEMLSSRTKSYVLQEQGDAMRGAGDLRGAIEKYGEAIHETASSAPLRFLRGTARMEMQDFSGAFADFKAGLAIEPENQTLRFLRDSARYQYYLTRLAQFVGVKRLATKISRVFGIGNAGRPWLYVREVLRPLAQQLNHAPGKMLVIGSPGAPLSRILQPRPNLTIWNLNQPPAVAEAISQIAAPQEFDHIAFQSTLRDVDLSNILMTLSEFLRPDGELTLVLPGTEAAKVEQALASPELYGFEIVETTPLGSLGTKLITRAFARWRVWVDRSLTRFRAPWLHLLIIPAALILFALLSLVAELLNVFKPTVPPEMMVKVRQKRVEMNLVRGFPIASVEAPLNGCDARAAHTPVLGACNG